MLLQAISLLVPSWMNSLTKLLLIAALSTSTNTAIPQSSLLTTATTTNTYLNGILDSHITSTVEYNENFTEPQQQPTFITSASPLLSTTTLKDIEQSNNNNSNSPTSTRRRVYITPIRNWQSANGLSSVNEDEKSDNKAEYALYWQDDKKTYLGTTHSLPSSAKIDATIPSKATAVLSALPSASHSMQISHSMLSSTPNLVPTSASLFIRHPFWAILMCIFVTIVIIATVIGNCMVCFAVLMVRKLKQQPANLLLVSLAVADFSVGLFVMPIALVNVLEDRWILGEFVCRLWTSADLMLCTASILSLCVISVDRYMAVTRALRYAALRTRKRMFVYICIVWIGALFVSVTPIIFLPLRTVEQHSCQVSQNQVYQIYATIISFYAPCIIMVVVYVQMWRAAKKIQLRDRAAHKWNFSMRPILNNRASGESTCIIDNDTETTLTQTVNYNTKSAKSKGKNCCWKLKKHEITDDNISTNNNEECLLNRNRSFPNSINTNINRVEDQIKNGHSTTNSTNGAVVISNQKSGSDQQLNKTLQRHTVARPVHPRNIFRYMLSSPTLTTTERNCTTATMTASSTTAALAAVIHSPLKRLQRPSAFFNAVRMPLLHSRHHDKGEDKARKTLGVIMSVFICCWVPFFILALVKSQYVIGVPKWLDVLVLWLGYSNSMLNPLIYCKYNREFRVPFREMLCCRFRTIQVVMRNESFYSKFGPPRVVTELRHNDIVSKAAEGSRNGFNSPTGSVFAYKTNAFAIGKRNSSPCTIEYTRGSPPIIRKFGNR